MEERNFRSHYYEKLSGSLIQEKKSLEILLKEKPVDRSKLVQFALRFSVPGIHRILLWKLLLDILPLYLDQHEFVLKQRRGQFSDLQHALHFIVHLPEKQSSFKFHSFVLMKYLESGNLKLDYTSQLCSRDSHIFITINEALSDVIDCDCDIFWISKGIFDLLKSFRPHYPALVNFTYKLLATQDPQLYQYLVSQKMLTALPLECWFENCFSGILPIVPLQRILDKVLGGSSMIMVFVVISLLSKLRQTIFKLNNIHKLVDSMKKLTESLSESVVTESLGLWQNYNCPLLPADQILKDHHHHHHHKPVQQKSVQKIA